MGDSSLQHAINTMGLGIAQFTILCISAGGISFSDGAELSLISIVSSVTAKEFSLSPIQEGTLMSTAVAGMFTGMIFAGYAGDTMGRRVPIVVSFALISAIGLLSTLVSNYSMLLGCRTMLGFGMGLGLPPSTALLSEVTPVRWRMLMRALNYIFWNLGSLFVCVSAGILDPQLDETLSWRCLLLICSCPAILLLVSSFFFLPDSPAFLESVGKHREAQDVLCFLQKMNGIADGHVDHEPPLPTSSSSTAEIQPLSEQLKDLFSPQLCMPTLIILFASFCIHMTSYGYAFASPQILTEVSSIPAAWQMVSSCAVAFPIIIGLWPIAQSLSRKSCIILALALNAAVSGAFAVSGAQAVPRRWYYEMLFQFGYLGNTAGSTLGYMVLFQVAVEIYPVTIAASGGALTMGVGRLGALLAPLLFEQMYAAFGWPSFFILTCFLNATAALLAVTLPLLETLPAKSSIDYGSMSLKSMN